jgi:hypothetical protein
MVAFSVNGCWRGTRPAFTSLFLTMLGCSSGQPPAAAAQPTSASGPPHADCMNDDLSDVDPTCAASKLCSDAFPSTAFRGAWRCANDWGFNRTLVSERGFVTVDWQAHSGSEYGHFQGCMDSTGLIPGKQVLLSAPLERGGKITRAAYANSTKLVSKLDGQVVALSNMTIEVPCQRLP